MQENKKVNKNNSDKQNPFIPSVKPSDIIEKSNKTSGDWLTRDIDRKSNRENAEDQNEEESNN